MLLTLLIAFLVALALHIIIRYPVYHLSRNFLLSPDSSQLPPLSVVVITHNNGNILQQNLQAIATQDYPDFEVIVVNNNSSDNSSDIIKIIENQYINVRHTFLPPSARYISRPKLAVTLGIKAAKNDWVVLTEGNCIPQSPQWLKTLGSLCSPEKDFVLGYANFEKNSSIFHNRIAFSRLLKHLRFLRSIGKNQKGRPSGASNCNLALRRSLFLENKGFYGNLQLLGGEDRLFIDKAAQKGKVAATCLPEATVRQEIPGFHQAWTNYTLNETEAVRHLSRHARTERLLWGFSGLCFYVYWVTSILLAGLLISQSYTVPALCLLGFVFIQEYVAALILYTSVKQLGETPHPFQLLLRNFLQPLRTFYYKLYSHQQRRNLMRGEG